jgi:Domain of unknown function (DUF4352)
VSTLLNFELTDAEGRKYNQSIVADTGTAPIDGTVPPNDQRRGVVVYEVPVGITGLELRVKGDLSSGGTVFTL